MSVKYETSADFTRSGGHKHVPVLTSVSQKVMVLHFAQFDKKSDHFVIKKKLLLDALVVYKLPMEHSLKCFSKKSMTSKKQSVSLTNEPHVFHVILHTN